MDENRNLITIRPEINDFTQRVDEYVSGLPELISEQMRQALHAEYEEDYARTEAICLEMLKEMPDHPEVLGLLGRCRLSQRKFEEAREPMERAVELDPDEMMNRISLGITYHALGECKRAVDQLEMADPSKEYHPFYYSTLGDCYQKIGKPAKARDAFRAEVTRYENTRQIESPDNLDGCFCNLIYLDGSLSRFMELKVDLAVYRRFLDKIQMTPHMQMRLASNISYWASLLSVRGFRAPFIDFIREVENEGYLLDSEYYYIIDNAYRSEESYRYHEDSRIDSFIENLLSACSRPEPGQKDDAAVAAALSYQWYLSRCIEEYADDLLYAAEKYPHSYARLVTFLDQLSTFGPEKTREMILDRLINIEHVKVGREELAAGLDTAYERARSVRKEPVYLSEGNVTYRREAKKILPNDPCPCGSGKKYKKCHGRV